MRRKNTFTFKNLRRRMKSDQDFARRPWGAADLLWSAILRQFEMGIREANIFCLRRKNRFTGGLGASYYSAHRL
ncbi:MAG: hypothetical protein ACLPSF_05930 [Methylocella sp.]